MRQDKPLFPSRRHDGLGQKHFVACLQSDGVQCQLQSGSAGIHRQSMFAAYVGGELLLELHAQEKTILCVVTHSQELAKLLPRRMEMNEGRLVPVEGVP